MSVKTPDNLYQKLEQRTKEMGQGLLQQWNQINSKKITNYANLRMAHHELKILSMIAQGSTIQTMAEKLRISSKTINTYRYRLHDKLGLKNDVELVHFAIRYKLMP